MNKIAIITGGSKGLGYYLVKSYCEKDFNVISIARTKPSFKHKNLLANVAFDMTTDIDDLIIILRSYLEGNIDEIVLINNAGTLGRITTLDKLIASEISKTIQLNLTTPMVLSSFIIKNFTEVKTTIFNISSGAAVKAYYGWSVYCATKSGLELATKTIAKEQEKNNNFAVFCINPGIMDTQMQTQIRNSKKEDFIEIERFKNFKEENLLINPEIIANKIANLEIRNYDSGITIDVKSI